MYVNNFDPDRIYSVIWGKDDFYLCLDYTHLPYHDKNIAYLLFLEEICIIKEF
jgi:hypothetical protein